MGGGGGNIRRTEAKGLEKKKTKVVAPGSQAERG